MGEWRPRIKETTRGRAEKWLAAERERLGVASLSLDWLANRAVEEFLDAHSTGERTERVEPRPTAPRPADPSVQQVRVDRPGPVSRAAVPDVPGVTKGLPADDGPPPGLSPRERMAWAQRKIAQNQKKR